MEGRGKQALRIFQEAAEKQGYILASSNNTRDTLSISENIMVANRFMNKVFSLLPISRNGIYTGGYKSGGQFASSVPVFIKGIAGVLSWGSGVSNIELLDRKQPFYFIGIIEKEDFLYPRMLSEEKMLTALKFPSQLLIIEDADHMRKQSALEKALGMFTLSAMSKDTVRRDDGFVNESYRKSLEEINLLKGNLKLLDADRVLTEVITAYRPQRNIDSLKLVQRDLRKEKFYKSQKRSEDNVFLKEALIKDDYAYALEEDILTYNFKNLGWWNFQMEELKKYEKSSNKEEQQMGERLTGFLNALVEDNIDLLTAQTPPDEMAQNFLLMLKTILAPQDYASYLKVISMSAKNSDYGTALFYLEELLKNGYNNKTELYSVPHTALFRITPDFNEVVAKYLKEARYERIEQ
jgi:hypothetical protein